MKVFDLRLNNDIGRSKRTQYKQKNITLAVAVGNVSWCFLVHLLEIRQF